MTSDEAIAIAKAAVAEQRQGFWIEPVFAKLIDREDGGKSWWISNNEPENWFEHTIGAGQDVEIDDATGAVLHLRIELR